MEEIFFEGVKLNSPIEKSIHQVICLIYIRYGICIGLNVQEVVGSPHEDKKEWMCTKAIKREEGQIYCPKKNTQNKNEFHSFWSNKQLSQRPSFSGGNKFWSILFQSQ